MPFYSVTDDDHLVCLFVGEQDARDYCARRNNPPTEPKFKVGDRVLVLSDASGSIREITLIAEQRYVISHIGTYTESALVLASPEPPKPKWGVEYLPSVAGDWLISKMGQDRLRAHSESLAQQVADLLNAEAEG
jgi:hypothetical protein